MRHLLQSENLLFVLAVVFAAASVTGVGSYYHAPQPPTAHSR